MNILPNSFFTWDAEERHEFLKNILKVDCEVTFTKVDGSLRIMPCTLRKDAIPEKLAESKRTKAFNPSVMSVWCLDRKEWRSFRVDNVISIKTILETVE